MPVGDTLDRAEAQQYPDLVLAQEVLKVRFSGPPGQWGEDPPRPAQTRLNIGSNVRLQIESGYLEFSSSLRIGDLHYLIASLAAACGYELHGRAKPPKRRVTYSAVSAGEQDGHICLWSYVEEGHRLKARVELPLEAGEAQQLLEWLVPCSPEWSLEVRNGAKHAYRRKRKPKPQPQPSAW
jgi:hypothetical protein